MFLNSNSLRQSERFSEGEDTFTWKHLVLRGAARLQSSQTTTSRDTVFVRGAIQANLKRISAYANFEKGNDLVNRSVFSTSAYSNTVIGFSIPLPARWNLQAEAFRNNLNTTLTAQNVFLFPTENLGVTQLPGFEQWSGYFRLEKQFHWGNKEFSAAGGIDQYAATRVPLVGSVQGQVMEASLAGTRPAASVAVSLDLYRSSVTDASGHYSFSDVPEGSHVVGLDMDQLPTDYEPGPDSSARVVVQPRALVRTDFTVARLTNIAGRIIAPTGVAIDSVVIRLAGTNRYTTPDQDGSFSFYDLREGVYNVAIDAQTIPEETILASPDTLQVSASSENQASIALEFKLEPKPQPEKPVRLMLREQIHVQSKLEPAAKSPTSTGRKNTKKAANQIRRSANEPGD
jgi:hypothetical protein